METILILAVFIYLWTTLTRGSCSHGSFSLGSNNMLWSLAITIAVIMTVYQFVTSVLNDFFTMLSSSPVGSILGLLVLVGVVAFLVYLWRRRSAYDGDFFDPF